MAEIPMETKNGNKVLLSWFLAVMGGLLVGLLSTLVGVLFNVYSAIDINRQNVAAIRERIAKIEAKIEYVTEMLRIPISERPPYREGVRLPRNTGIGGTMDTEAMAKGD